MQVHSDYIQPKAIFRKLDRLFDEFRVLTEHNQKHPKILHNLITNKYRVRSCLPQNRVFVILPNKLYRPDPFTLLHNILRFEDQRRRIEVWIFVEFVLRTQILQNGHQSFTELFVFEDVEVVMLDVRGENVRAGFEVVESVAASGLVGGDAGDCVIVTAGVTHY